MIKVVCPHWLKKQETPDQKCSSLKMSLSSHAIFSKVNIKLIFIQWVYSFFNLPFNWRTIANRILLFSLKFQHESATGIYISAHFGTSLPSPCTSPPSSFIQSPCLSFLSHTANSRWLFYIRNPVNLFFREYFGPFLISTESKFFCSAPIHFVHHK